MSEFKYACPVCGQHIKCDTSQSGSVMECPTCFQKIVAPQAPANHDPKFIITGQKYVEKKIPDTLANAAATGTGAPQKGFPLGIFIVIAVVLAAGAGVIVFRGKIFKPASTGTATATAETTEAETNEPAAAAKSSSKTALVAPAASDTNWMLNLDGVTIPDGPIVGRIHGQDFICERAAFQNGSLTLRYGSTKTLEFGVIVDFSGAQPEIMAGKTINITTNVDQAAKVTLRWKENDKVNKDYFEDSYALRLEFGSLIKNKLSGKIYLCTPDSGKSYVMGTFDADARKPKPKTPKK